MTDALLAAFRGKTRVYDLSREYFVGMPQSPNHPPFWHALPRRHGDRIRGDGGSAASDIIVMGTHVGTHIDALGHVSQDGVLHGGEDASQAQVGGRFAKHGVDQIAPLLTRGLLLDVPRALGLDACEPGYEITPDDLDMVVRSQGTDPEPGDVLIVRSGWGRRWDDAASYIGHKSGVPGVGEAGARWLAERAPAAVGADTIAFERLAPGDGHAQLPAHRVLLIDAGINIIETMALEELASVEVHSFLFVAAPLRLIGATGSPLRPLAVTSGASHV